MLEAILLDPANAMQAINRYNKVNMGKSMEQLLDRCAELAPALNKQPAEPGEHDLQMDTFRKSFPHAKVIVREDGKSMAYQVQHLSNLKELEVEANNIILQHGLSLSARLNYVHLDNPILEISYINPKSPSNELPTGPIYPNAGLLSAGFFRDHFQLNHY